MITGHLARVFEANCLWRKHSFLILWELYRYIHIRVSISDQPVQFLPLLDRSHESLYEQVLSLFSNGLLLGPGQAKLKAAAQFSSV
jgi:hypothetical protein